MMLTIYHHPRCSKSRQTLALIKESGQEVAIVMYLETPLDKKQLKALCKKLGLSPKEITRTSEALFKTITKPVNDDDWYNALAEHPMLMQRPIVVKGDKAIVGRPPENVLALLN
jgi:arsenate reductase (glutaredoxin)